MMTPEPTRALYLIKLADTLLGAGHDAARMLSDAGLSPGQLAEADASIPLAAYVTAIESAMRRSGVADLGFRVGKGTRLTEHGVLGYALLSAENLGKSLRRYERYQYLQGPLLSVELVCDDDASLVARPIDSLPTLSEAALRYTIQEWAVGWNQWSALIGVRGPFFERVELAVNDHRHAGVYRRHLRCPVEFGAAVTRARFPIQYLDLPLRYADEGIAAMCAEQCEHILRHLNLGHGLVAEVHRQLAAVPGRVPGLNEIASHFNVDPRTLRRRLRRADTTYRRIVGDFRLALAQRYLHETRLPANEIAVLVGYADSGNLYRSFRRAFSMTPNQFRDRRAG